jgi:acyl homoserine lactone synthase
MEVDEFDALHPSYLLQTTGDGKVQGCVRMLPSTGPTMIRETFPALLDGLPPPDCATIWECSRFAIDLNRAPTGAAGGIAKTTYELFAGMIEFGLSRRLTEIVAVTDARLERILRRVGWPLRVVGTPRKLGPTIAMAGYLEISAASLARVGGKAGLKGPVLWQPVPLAAA